MGLSLLSLKAAFLISITRFRALILLFLLTTATPIMTPVTMSKTGATIAIITIAELEEELEVSDVVPFVPVLLPLSTLPVPLLVLPLLDEPSPELLEEPSPELFDDPSPELLEEPSPELLEDPSPELFDEPSPELVEPSPELVEPSPELLEDPSPELFDEPSPELEEPSPELVEPSPEFESVELVAGSSTTGGTY